MTLVFTAAGVKPEDLGPNEDIARRVLIHARRIAPWLRAAGEGGELQADVLAILKGVYKRAADIGTGVIASQGRNGTNRSYRDVRSAFWRGDIEDLRSLDPTQSTPDHGALPASSFPADRPLSRLFPESYS